MTDLPDEIMVWRSMEKLTHIGTWATERYPDEAVAYIPRADAEAAMAAVVERAAKDLDERGQHEQINFGLDRATQNFYRARDIVRAFAPPPGLAMLAELRAERDAADQRAGAMLARIVALEADGEAARSAASTNFARAETAEADRDRLAAANAVLEAKVAGLVGDQRFYIDCEFDGHNGPLLSIAMVREDGWGLHVEVAGVVVEDPWVLENIVPILAAHEAPLSCRVRPNEVGRQLRHFIGDCHRPTIIADSPVDIGRFCRAISTGEDGGWASTVYPGMTFEVRNVDCYPTTLEGAVQHNAWWDAMALRAALATQEAGT